ncbi:hypothetical protein N657DRAFT_580763 [Parathielavia appendiculata]|uniref:Uncharacterized protein n=1 Tax=Parathielavia appendiculata TaxID=2587402 RepID=A0AAN6TSZ2_9PEZI|nr:hypothetical protein N657DRAFT_580763 [Parathielavia appendiculata]
MSQSCVWLDLRSGAPGLPGPYLCEFFSPYRYLDSLGNVCPTIILAVGGQNKRRYMSNHLSVSYDDVETNTITLRNLALPHMLLVDGELHQRNELPRIKAGPSPGLYDTHEIKRAPKSAAEISYQIYFDVLAPFSSAVLLFVSDLNGTDVTVDVLAQWAKRMMAFPPAVLPKVLLFFDDSPAPNSADIRQQISMKLLEYLRLGPNSTYTFSDAKRIISNSYDIHVLTNRPSDDLWDNLISITDNAASQRQDLRLHFSATHLRQLVQAAIVHFSGRLVGPFNIYRASRANNPVPETLRECVSNFVRFTTQKHVDSARVVASALVMDAYPPGMHRFYPLDLYRDLYEPILLAVQGSEALPDFSWTVKAHFVEMANQRERDQPWEFQVYHCPLCHRPNQGTFKLIPQTAGVRVLKLDYTADWLRQVSEKLLADLFFIEITRAPCFYSAPRILSVQLRCRVQSAPALMDLVMKLHAQQMHIYYRGDEVSYKHGALCTPALVERCKTAHSFVKEITVTVESLRSSIDIRIGRTRNEWQSISNCPYILEQLIHDQGLNGRFGGSGRQPPTPPGGRVPLGNELDRLQTVLAPLVKTSR